MKTKFITLLLGVAASIGTMHAAIVNGTCGDNLTWSLNTKDSTLNIIGSGEMIDLIDFGDNSAPWSDYKSYIAYVSLPDGLTSIGYYAFADCSSLTSIEIPNSVTSIGRSAFRNCTGLTSMTIGNSVTSIGSSAFSGCSGLTSVTIPNSVTSIELGAFAGCSGLTAVTIGNSVTSIGDDAFYYCTGLTSIEIPNSVTSIGDDAFRSCSGLTSVTIGNSVTSIGSSAFLRCSGLTSVNISDVAAWCAIIFGNCEANPLYYAHYLYLNDELLTDLVIPNSVTIIGDNAFNGCYLSSVTCEATTPPAISSNTFSNKTILIFVPEESIEAYQNALYWEEFTDIRAIGSAPLVQFLDWDGIILSSANVTIGTAATAPADPTRTGYTFIGWDKDFSNITEDLVVTAQYKINRYEVIFKDWDETILKTDSVDYNTAATAPANPSREGHEFIGWDKDFSHVSSDMIINARYAVNYYPVGFLNYDGTLLSEQSIAYNQAAMEPNVPAREGYTFIGWTADIEHITARTFAIALYEKNGINVTYISEEGDTIVSEKVDMRLPDAPVVSGKTFTGWLTESASNAEGIVFRATYTLDNPTTGEDVVVIPTSSTAGVSFPYITGAMTYMLVIRDLFGTVICKIMFDADGHLLGIAFAPGRNRTQKAQSEGFHFNVEGLTPGTTYEYEFVAYDEVDQVIETLTGSFETTADEMDVNNISSASAPQKVINDGHVLILRDDKTYTMQGQEVK